MRLECTFSNTRERQNLERSLRTSFLSIGFEGITDQQQTIRAEGTPRHWSTYDSEFRLSVECNRMEVVTTTNKKATCASYHLVNLEFSGTEPYSSPMVNGRSLISGQLPLDLGVRTLVIRPLADYDDIWRHIKKTRGVAATAAIEARVQSLQEARDVGDVVDDVCMLLSLARGCRIAAINYEVADENGYTAYFIGRRVPPKGYGFHVARRGDIHIVDAHHGESVKRFVEGAYPHLSSAKENWSIVKALEYYLDAKREGDEFEFWGLKMSMCMEFLRSQYLKCTGGDSILSDNHFAKITSRLLKPELKEALQEQVADISEGQIEAILSRTKELNRYSFATILKRMNCATKARIGDDAVAKFVRIRNHLVHQGRYVENLGTPYEQYMFLDEYVYRFLLSILCHPMDSVWAGYNWSSDGMPVVDSLKSDLTP